MTKIRSSEEKLKNLQNPQEVNNESENIQYIINQPEQEVEIIQENEMIDKYKIEEVPCEIVEIGEDFFEEKESQSERVCEPKRKKLKTSNSSSSLLYTHYELEKEDDENTITLLVTKKEMPIPTEPIYFDSSSFDYMNHAEDACIYKCKYCVKAFSNSEHLVKHTVISHLCVFCYQIFPNFKELNLHSKNNKKKDLYCRICDDFIEHSNFRQHLKVKHKITSSQNIGISFG